MQRPWIIILTALVLAAYCSVAAGSEVDQIKEDLWGRKVAKLEYEIPQWLHDKEIARVCKIKEGKVFSRWRVRTSISRLYLLGYLENIVIKATPVGDDQVNVLVKIYPQYLIRDINLKGNHALNYAEIVDDTLHISTSDDFRQEDIPVFEEKIRDYYRDIGYLKAEARIHVEKTKLKNDAAADLFIEITEGPAYKVAKINIVGDMGPFSRRQILKKLRWKEKMVYKKEVVDDGLRRLREKLKGGKYFEARIGDVDLRDADAVKVDHQNMTMEFTLELDVGPKILMGYSEECFTCAQKKWKLNKHLDVENNRRFTKYIVEPYSKNIEEYFQAKGYLDASCQGRLIEAADEDGNPIKRLEFTLEKGRRYSVEEIDFKNNPSFSDGELKGELEAGKYFIKEDFDKNLDNIIAFYNRHGFLKAKILQKNAEIDEGEGEIFINAVIFEGPQTRVRSVKLVGNEVIKDKKFANLLQQGGLVEGQPYNPFKLVETKTRMIAKYLIRGYIKARIKHKIVLSEDNTQIDVTYEFEEGRQYFFGNVYIHGNKLTKKHVIERELFITTGDPFNYDDVFASQQQLMKLGFFSSVDIKPINPDIDQKEIDLMVTVEERNSGYIEGGIGFNTYSGYQGAFEIGHKNLAGHGRKLSFRTDVYFSDEQLLFEQRTIALNFIWPWIARIPVDGDFTIKDDLRHNIGYDLRQLEMVTALNVDFPKFFYRLRATRHNEMVRWASKFWSGKLAYAYSRDFIFSIDDSVDQDHGEVTIATISPQLTRDSRDNYYNPKTGKVYMGMIEWGSPPLFSQVNYLKVIGQLSWYEPIHRWWGAKDGPVLALNYKAGHLQELRDTDTVPINRRFYLGGSSTIRGFGQDEISVYADDGRTPIGGYFFGYTNTEIRTPLGESGFGLLFFFDAGDVTGETKYFYIDQLRATSGLGFRYLTPVGPISADYGIKLNKEPYESLGEFYITIGNAF